MKLQILPILTKFIQQVVSLFHKQNVTEAGALAKTRKGLPTANSTTDNLKPELFPSPGKVDENNERKLSPSKGGRPPKNGKVWKCRLDEDNYNNLSIAADLYGCDKTWIVNYVLRKELSEILKTQNLF